MKRLLKALLVFTAAHAAAGLVFRKRRRLYAGERKHFLVTQGGAQVRPTPNELRDAVISVMMGGLRLDLREVKLDVRPAHLDVLAVMGGVELLVPEDWRVQSDVEAVMGGVEDAREGPADPDRPVDLSLRGRVIMGGLEITSPPPAKEGR